MEEEIIQEAAPQKKFRSRTAPYLQAIPYILRYQLVTKSILILLIIGLRVLSMLVLGAMGKSAVTSGDYSFLFGSWYGLLLLVIGLAALFLYVAFDLNSTIVYSAYLLKGETGNIMRSMWQGFRSIYRFFTPHGIGVVAYILLLIPVVSVELSLSLTSGFNMPNFIVNEINANPFFLWGYRLLLVLFLLLGVINIFILHGVLLDNMSMKTSRKNSRALLGAHWKSFIYENLRFLLFLAVLVALTVGLFSALPLYLLSKSGDVAGLTRFLTIFFFLLGIAMIAFFALVIRVFYIMKLTQLYDYYRDGEKEFYPRHGWQKHRVTLIINGVVAAVCLISAIVLNVKFETVFPKTVAVDIISHRGGGYEDLENTVSGLNTAIDMGAYGSEIDIQRTLDGYYIVNHDTTFKRLTGIPKKPWKMTLAEIRMLTIKGKGSFQGRTEPIATLEEMLDASKGKIILYIELKGSTADRQMAEDVVNMIKERDMLEECVLISLKYNIIDYIETTWPEVQTGCLIYASYGNASRLNCDFLGLEEEAATGLTIAANRAAGKKVLVWTPNRSANLRHFLLSRADAVITDNVSGAFRIREELKDRTDLMRIVDGFLGVFGISRS